jgi:hypothetical protein
MKITRCVLVLVALALICGTAAATPLTMQWNVTDIGGGMYDYEFWLTLDDNDHTWQQGQGWGWLIVADAQSADSPLYDFDGDYGDFPVGPWDSWGWSFGYHNGPTLHYVLDCWVPQEIGETLYFSGTSSVLLHDGEMLWSSIYTIGGAQTVEFEVATLIPAPGALSLLAMAGLAGRRRRR